MSKHLLFLSFLALPLGLAGAAPFAYPTDAPRSGAYRVFVNDREVFVYENPVGSIAIFEMDGPVDVRVESANIVRHVVARPLSAGIRPDWGGKAAHLSLPRPMQLSVEFNGLIRDPLFLFAHPVIEAPRENRRGRLLFFEGGKTHEPGVVRLRNHDEVFLEGGAVVKGVFLADGATDIKIHGPGIIDASVGPELEMPAGFRRRVISLLDCENVVLKDFCISDGRTWQIVPNRSRDILIDGVKIISNDGGDDGIDVVRSQKVEIRNSFFHTKDDCIAIKAHSPDPQLRPSRDILIRNNIFWNARWGNGFEIGFELRTPEPIANIRLSDCDFIHVEKGAVLSIHNADYAVVEDVVFENIRVEDARQKLLDFAIFWTKFSEDGPKSEAELERRYQHGGVWDNVMEFTEEERPAIAARRGHIRNITVRNLRIVDGGLPFSIFSGFDADHQVEGVTIENIRLYDQRIDTPEALKLFTEFTQGVNFVP